METAYAEFDWESPSIEENNGHNQSEWGMIKVRQNDLHTIIPLYKVRWEKIP